MTPNRQSGSADTGFVLAIATVFLTVVVVLAVLSFMEKRSTKENLCEFQGTSSVEGPSSNEEGAFARRIRTLRSVLGALAG